MEFLRYLLISRTKLSNLSTLRTSSLRAKKAILKCVSPWSGPSFIGNRRAFYRDAG